MLICLLAAINFATDGLLFQKFAMDTHNFYSQMEVWRVFSMPVWTDSFAGLLLFLAAFYFLSPRLETFFGKKIYPLFMLLISVLIGIITTIVFVNSNYIFGGIEGLAFFVFSLYYFLRRKKILIKDTPLTNTLCITTVLT